MFDVRCNNQCLSGYRSAAYREIQHLQPAFYPNPGPTSYLATLTCFAPNILLLLWSWSCVIRLLQSKGINPEHISTVRSQTPCGWKTPCLLAERAFLHSIKLSVMWPEKVALQLTQSISAILEGWVSLSIRTRRFHQEQLLSRCSIRRH